MGSLSIDIDSELVTQLRQQMRPLETFSAFFRRITEELKNERTLRELFQKYVPKQVLEELSPQYASLAFWDLPSELEDITEQPDSSDSDKKGPLREKRIISTSTVMFCSLRDIMRLTESLGQIELLGLYGHYSSAIADLVTEHMGLLSNAMPETIVACWGGPGIANKHALLACKCALHILERSRAMFGNSPHNQRFDIRIGINSGAVLLPSAGDEKTIDATLAGNAVSLAAGLAEANKQFGTQILIGQSTYYEIAQSGTAREVAEVILAGTNRPITIYELLEMQSEY